MRHDDHRRPGDQPDRRKILGTVVAGIGTEADGAQQHGDGVAVRRGLGGVAGADHAAGAAAILDHDLLAERVRKLLPDDAAHRIDAAAGRIGHDHGDRAGRIILRRGRSRHRAAAAPQPARSSPQSGNDSPAHHVFPPRRHYSSARRPCATLWPRRKEAPCMRFGLFGSATARHGGPDVDSGQGYKQFVEYNVEAEALGYHATFLVEHHFTGFGQVSASLSLLTWVAAKTKTLRLGTAVLVLPWHNPVLLAEQAATIDLLSGGRLDFGVGKGYRHNEFAGFCVPIEEADARFNESLDVIVKSWTSKQRFSHHGKYWNFEDIIVEPPTAQKPHPPMWMGAGSPDSIRQVAARGYNLLLDQFASFEAVAERIAIFKAEVEKRGRVFDPMDVGVARAFHVSKDAADKEAALERRMEAQRRLATISKAPDGTNKSSIMAFSDTREASEESALYGTPDEIAEKLGKIAQARCRICAAQRRRPGRPHP
jgi:alkanesulfonate monooxygenase SsuD/methylene tetrahydromethanopterin reductase-like flavin-dependent oxidoreductase (luciferase family)